MDACPTQALESMTLEYSRAAEIGGDIYIWHVYALPRGRKCALLESPSALALTASEYARLERAANAAYVPPDYVAQVWPQPCDTLVSKASAPASFGVRVRSDLVAIPPTLASAAEYCIAFGDYLLHARQRLTAQPSMHYLQSYGTRFGAINSQSIVDPRGSASFPANVEHCEPYCRPVTPAAGPLPYAFTYADSTVAALDGGAIIAYPDSSPPRPPFVIGIRDATLSQGRARVAGFAPAHFTAINPKHTPALPYLTLQSPAPLQIIDPLDAPVAVSASSSDGGGGLQFLLNGEAFTTLPNARLLPGDNIVTVRRYSDGLAASHKVRALITSAAFSAGDDTVVSVVPEAQVATVIDSAWTVQNPPQSTLESVELWRRVDDGAFVRLLANAAQTNGYSEPAPMNSTYVYQLRKRFSHGSRVLAEQRYRIENGPPRVISVAVTRDLTGTQGEYALQIGFDQTVQTGPGWINLRCGAIALAVTSTGTDSSRTVRVGAGLQIPAGVTCSARVNSKAVVDQVGLRLPEDYNWTFTASH